MLSVYFSCREFTVRLMVRGPSSCEAAPIVKKFEGQTIGALTSWAQSKFGGPIIVEKLSEYAASRSRAGLGYSEASSSRSSRRASNSSETSMPSSSRSAKSISPAQGNRSRHIETGPPWRKQPTGIPSPPRVAQPYPGQQSMRVRETVIENSGMWPLGIGSFS